MTTRLASLFDSNRTWTRNPARPLAVLAALTAFGCSESSAPNPAVEADAGTGGPLSACPADVSGCADASSNDAPTTDSASLIDAAQPAFGCPTRIQGACDYSWLGQDVPLNLRASEIDPALRFVDMDPSRLQILAVRDGQTPAPVVVHPMRPLDQDAGDWTWTLSEMPSSAPSGLQPVAIASAVAAPAGGMQTFVLLCAAQSCSLYGLQEEFGTTIEQVPGGEVPTTSKLTGIAYDPKDNSVVVYGEGVFRFRDSGWTTEIAPGTGGELRYIHASAGKLIAVGDSGRIEVTGDAGWESVSSNTNSSLLSVDALSNTITDFLAVGAAGSLVFQKDTESLNCTLGSEDLVGVGNIGLGTPTIGANFSAVTASGQVAMGGMGQGTSWCAWGKPIGKALRGGVYPCGVIRSFVALTSDGFWGHVGCAVD